MNASSAPQCATSLPLNQLRRALLPLLALSAVSNLAILVSPIFMMQVLDRVVPTGNLNTLLLLLAVASLALLLQAVVDGLRDLSLHRIARWFETVLIPHVLFGAADDRTDRLQLVTQLKAAVSGSAATAALSLPWIPLFVFVLWAIHPWFAALAAGLVAAAAALRLAGASAAAAHQGELTRLHAIERRSLQDAQKAGARTGQASLTHNVLLRFQNALHARSQLEELAAPSAIATQTLSSYLRGMTQLLGLSLGAALVTYNSLSAGGMIAASLILTKTVTAVETGILHLADLQRAKQAFRELAGLPAHVPPKGTEIETISGKLRCDGLIVPRGGGAPPRLDRISFDLSAGACLAIVGPSGSGKSTLLEALSGVAPSPIGTVWMDESEVSTLPRISQTAHIGYLPQQAQLYHCTLAQNICGFTETATDRDIVAAAQIAGVHGLISALPDSYDTDIGRQPYLLSAGQKQRVALARAVFHRPRYLFMDEPNALLDAAGERQLCAVLARLKKQGTTVVMVIHRSGLMGLADMVLAMDNGRMSDFGPRSDVLGRMSGGRRRLEVPLRKDSLQDLVDWVGAQFTRGNDADLSHRAELIACELFHLAQASGPQDEPRRAVFLFRFLSDRRCEITLTENRVTRACGKMKKVAQLLHHPDAQIGELPTDEAALAVITRMSDDFDIQNLDGQAIYRAAVSMRAVAPTGMARH